MKQFRFVVNSVRALYVFRWTIFYCIVNKELSSGTFDLDYINYIDNYEIFFTIYV